MESIQFNTALVRLQNAGDKIEKRGLAATAGAAEGHLLRGVERENGHIHHRLNEPVRCSIAFAQIFDC